MTRLEREAIRPGELIEHVRRLADDARLDSPPDVVRASATRAWIYAPGDFEAAALARIVAEGFAANRHVDYARNFAAPHGFARFAVSGPAGAIVRITAHGAARVFVEGRPLGADGVIGFSSAPNDTEVLVSVEAPTGEPAAVSLDADAVSGTTWRFIGSSGQRAVVVPRFGGDRAPHLADEPVTVVDLAPRGAGVFEAPFPVLGVVELLTDDGPAALRSGESVEEAMADDGVSESHHDLREIPGGWASTHRLGLRFVRVIGARARSVRVHASVRPMPRRGAFAASDPSLTRMWAKSATTLHSCLQTFLLDGIKRDRMPWAGDAALGVLTDAYAWGDAGIVRDTLVALGRPREGYINGIVDYSLWWVIAHGLYAHHFGDPDFLDGQAESIDAVLAGLALHARDDDALLRTPDVAGQFVHAGGGGFFLDWGVRARPGEVMTAPQVLWWWALRTAADVLGSVGHPSASRWRELADRLEQTLSRRSWDADSACWTAFLGAEEHDGYANFLAILAGLRPPDGSGPEGIGRSIVRNPPRTPFMRTFAALALARAGDPGAALAQLRAGWGGGQDAMVSTFAEEFGQHPSPWAMYGRPFGKSLTHAWSAGPAAALPAVVLGLRPFRDGWEEIEIDPHLDELEWVGAVVPSPRGDIGVLVERGRIVAALPPGVTLRYRDRLHTGDVEIDTTSPVSVRPGGERGMTE